MLKNQLKRYPGLGAALLLGQFLLIAVSAIVIYLDARTISAIRRAEENRAEAVLAADFRVMEEIAEDSTLPPDKKRMLLYQKTQSAVEALANTGYASAVKLKLTEALNGLSRHMLEADVTGETPLLSGEEAALLRLLGHTTAAEVSDLLTTEKSSPPTSEETKGAYAPHMGTWMDGMLLSMQKAGEERANLLFGVNGVLHRTEGMLFTCKNAYAVLDGVELYPIEAAIALPVTEERFTAAECAAAARAFFEEAYPKRIRRRLTEVSETDSAGFTEVVFRGNAGIVWVKMSKANGRMVAVRSEIARDG